jgi:hypothetical protein
MARLGLRPRVEDGADRGQQISEIGGFAFQQCADVRTRGAAVSPLSGDFCDLREGQAKTPGAGDKLEQAEHLLRVDAIPGRRSAGTWKDPA